MIDDGTLHAISWVSWHSNRTQ